MDNILKKINLEDWEEENIFIITIFCTILLKI